MSHTCSQHPHNRVLPRNLFFIITDKVRTKGGPGRKANGVGVMKDKQVKFEETEVCVTH